MNLRNMAAHGFKFDFAPFEAALLIRVAGLFCAMPVGKEIDADRSMLRDPLAAARRPLRRKLSWHWV